MMRKRLGLIFLCALLISIVVGCSKEENTVSSATVENQLSVYCHTEDYWFRNIIRDYNSEHKDYKIKLLDFNYFRDLETTREKILAEIMSGGGQT